MTLLSDDAAWETLIRYPKGNSPTSGKLVEVNHRAVNRRTGVTREVCILNRLSRSVWVYEATGTVVGIPNKDHYTNAVDVDIPDGLYVSVTYYIPEGHIFYGPKKYFGECNGRRLSSENRDFESYNDFQKDTSSDDPIVLRASAGKPRSRSSELPARDVYKYTWGIEEAEVAAGKDLEYLSELGILLDMRPDAVPFTTHPFSQKGLISGFVNELRDMPQDSHHNGTYDPENPQFNRSHINMFIVDNEGVIGKRFINFGGKVMAIASRRDPNMISGLYIASNCAVNQDGYRFPEQIEHFGTEEILAGECPYKLATSFTECQQFGDVKYLLEKQKTEYELMRQRYEAESASRNEELAERKAYRDDWSGGFKFIATATITLLGIVKLLL